MIASYQHLVIYNNSYAIIKLILLCYFYLPVYYTNFVLAGPGAIIHLCSLIDDTAKLQRTWIGKIMVS